MKTKMFPLILWLLMYSSFKGRLLSDRNDEQSEAYNYEP